MSESKIKSVFNRSLGVRAEDFHLLIIIYIAFFTNGLMSNLFGAILPDIKAEYHLNYVISGLLITSHQIGNVLALILAGFLPVIIGRKRSTCYLFLGVPLGLFGMCVCGLPFFLLFSFMLTGLGRGTLSNISNVVVSEITQNKVAGLNILHATFAIGAMIAPFVAILACAIFPFGWKVASVIIALVALLSIFLIAKSNLKNKSQEKLETVALNCVTPFYKSVQYYIVTAILFFYLYTESAIMGFLVTYFKDAGIMTGTFAKSTAAFLWIMVLSGRLLCAVVSSKVGKNKLILLLNICLVVFFTLMIKANSMQLVIVGLLGTGFFMSGIYPTTFSTMNSYYAKDTVAVGICLAVATIGAILGPVVVGAVAQATSITIGITSIAVSLAITLLLSILKLAFRL